jgi:hypothetical protein
MLGSIIGDIALWCLCLATTLSHRGGEVDGLVYPLHRRTANSHLPRGQGLPVRRHHVLSL